MKNQISLFLILFISNLALAQITKDNASILIKNVNIINVLDGSLLMNTHVTIKNGKIDRISDEFLKVEKHKLLIDGSGKFLIPGLAEMHAHIPPPSTGETRIEETLFLYLSNGITTIRGMLGHPSHLILKKKAKNGEILSPRIFSSSPSLNGNSVRTKEEAIRKVKAYKVDGYDFLKIHPGIKKVVFDQVVKTANEVNIKFAGHVPVDVGVKHALKSGYASIDHVDGFVEGLVPERLGLDPNQNGFFGYNFTLLADESKMSELVQLSKINNVWIVPTQSLFERWFAPITSDELLKASEMKYMPATTLTNWKNTKDRYTLTNPDFNKNQWKLFNNLRLKLIKELHDNGPGLLLGSDAPQLFNVPGFSIHHEIQGMVNAGLSPLEILQSGTINPARFFDMEDRFGQIKEGLDADMVLLNVNPLDDIKALKEINGIFVKGRWISQKGIEQKLIKIAENAAQN